MAEKRIDIIIGARNATGGAMAQVRSQMAGLVASLRGMAAAGGALLGAVGVGEFLRQSVQEFFSAEKAATELAEALSALGPKAAAGQAGIEMLAQRMQELTILEDDQVIALSATIARLGDLSGPALQQATIATLGLARATGMDQTQAAKAFLNATNGNYGALSRYAPLIRTATTDTEKMAVVNSLAAKGLALLGAETSTAYGAFARFRVSLGNVMEAIGGALAPAVEMFSNGLRDNMAVLQQWIAAAGSGVQAVAGVWQNFTAGGAFGMLSIGTALSELADQFWAFFTGLTSGLTNAFLTVKWAFENSLTIMGNFISNAGRLFDDLWQFVIDSGTNAVIALQNVLSGRDISTGMINTIRPALDAIQTLSANTSKLILDDLTNPFEVLPSELTKFLRAARDAARNELDRGLQQTFTPPAVPDIATALGFVGPPAPGGNDKQRAIGGGSRGGGGGSGRATILGERFLGLADAAASREVELLLKIEKATQQGAKAAEETLDAIGDLTRAIERSGGDDLPLLA